MLLGNRPLTEKVATATETAHDASSDHAVGFTGLLTQALLLEPDLGELVDAGADTPHMLAVYLCALDLDFDIPDTPELAEAIHRIATRCTRVPTPGHSFN